MIKFLLVQPVKFVDKLIYFLTSLRVHETLKRQIKFLQNPLFILSPETFLYDCVLYNLKHQNFLIVYYLNRKIIYVAFPSSIKIIF